MIERWSASAVDGICTEPYLVLWPEGANPATHHLPVDRRIFAFADGYATAEAAEQALVTYLAAVDRPQSWALPTERATS